MLFTVEPFLLPSHHFLSADAFLSFPCCSVFSARQRWSGLSSAENGPGEEREIRWFRFNTTVGIPPPGDYVMVSPRPARGSIRVDFTLLNGGAESVSVVDMLGRVVHRQEIEGYPRHGTLQLDLTRVPVGSYLLLLHTPLRITSTPLVIE